MRRQGLGFGSRSLGSVHNRSQKITLFYYVRICFGCWTKVECPK